MYIYIQHIQHIHTYIYSDTNDHNRKHSHTRHATSVFALVHCSYHSVMCTPMYSAIQEGVCVCHMKRTDAYVTVSVDDTDIHIHVHINVHCRQCKMPSLATHSPMAHLFFEA